MPGSEIAHRDRARRSRLTRQARFPIPKSTEGLDWASVSFPDGWSREEMLSLGFIPAAEDLVFFGQTGRGNYAEKRIMSGNGLPPQVIRSRQPRPFA